MKVGRASEFRRSRAARVLAASKPRVVNAPRVSVVTVVRDAVATIEETISSVACQRFANREYIIVDGASRDGTLDVISKHRASIDKFVSAPDAGIASAMNRALRLCEGDFVLFLHADDYLLDDDSLARVAPVLAEGSDIVTGPIVLQDAVGERTTREVRQCVPRIWFKTCFWHQATLCRRDLFDRIGPFDESYRIAMDYEFFLRAYRRCASVSALDAPFSVMRTTGISGRLDRANLRARFAEERRVHLAHASNDAVRRAYLAYWSVYPKLRAVLDVVRRRRQA